MPKEIDVMKLTTRDIKKLRTIWGEQQQGHTDNLIYETGSCRVWLSRLTIEDGMPYNDQITVENREANSPKWETIKKYQLK